MEANVKVGDFTLLFSEVRSDQYDQRHTITAIDHWNAIVPEHTPVSRTIVVADEPDAIAVLRSFLEPDLNPEGAFAKLFPEFTE